jgi:hypothetical protein
MIMKCNCGWNDVVMSLHYPSKHGERERERKYHINTFHVKTKFNCFQIEILAAFVVTEIKEVI